MIGTFIPIADIMNLDQEFHELFYVPEVPKKSRFTDRSRLRARVGKNHPEHYRYHKLKSVSDGSKNQKDKKSSKSQSSLSGVLPSMVTDPPIIELNSNPSMFKVFATIRQAVIEKKLRNESLIFVRSLQGFNSCDEANDESDQDEISKESPIKVTSLHSVEQQLTLSPGTESGSSWSLCRLPTHP